MEKPISYLDWKLDFQKNNLKDRKESLNLSVGSEKEFKDLLKNFSKRKSLLKSGGLLSSQFNFNNLNLDDGIIECGVNDPPNKEFKIEVNRKKQFINHKCQEFRSVNKFEKYFCSHLIRLFFILKEINVKQTINLLNHISSNDYNFFPKRGFKK